MRTSRRRKPARAPCVDQRALRNLASARTNQNTVEVAVAAGPHFLRFREFADSRGS